MKLNFIKQSQFAHSSLDGQPEFFDPPLQRNSEKLSSYLFGRVEVHNLKYDFAIDTSIWSEREFETHWLSVERKFEDAEYPFLNLLNISHDEEEHCGSLSRWLWVERRSTLSLVYYGEAWNNDWRAYTGDNLSFASIENESRNAPKVGNGLLALVAWSTVG